MSPHGLMLKVMRHYDAPGQRQISTMYQHILLDVRARFYKHILTQSYTEL